MKKTKPKIKNLALGDSTSSCMFALFPGSIRHKIEESSRLQSVSARSFEVWRDTDRRWLALLAGLVVHQVQQPFAMSKSLTLAFYCTGWDEGVMNMTVGEKCILTISG
ncbi:hypothetical protein H101_08080 [Trichophyton interdigitale H6]|nr:hypothetical protein H101_08080 [Trichophyton interdigitale H6]